MCVSVEICKNSTVILETGSECLEFGIKVYRYSKNSSCPVYMFNSSLKSRFHIAFLRSDRLNLEIYLFARCSTG